MSLQEFLLTVHKRPGLSETGCPKPARAPAPYSLGAREVRISSLCWLEHCLPKELPELSDAPK